MCLDCIIIPLIICNARAKNKACELARKPCFGGDEGDRTPYLLNAIQALSQVSYAPILAQFRCDATYISIQNQHRFVNT